MREEVFVHEAVVGFWVIARDANIFVLFHYQPRSYFNVLANTNHVEGNDIAKRDLAGLVPLHEDTIDNLWTATGRKTEDKRLLRCRAE